MMVRRLRQKTKKRVIFSISGKNNGTSAGGYRCPNDTVRSQGRKISNPRSEYYRQRAEQMARQAQSAETDALRRSYLAIAENWQRLADQEAKTQQIRDEG